MKKIILALSLNAGSFAFANDSITLKIDSLTNISGNGAMEACGTAIHRNGTKPLLVTVKHDQSYYTTLTAANGIWCVVVKRWTYDGNIEAGSATLSSPDEIEFKALPVKLERLR